jgi:hypothetical protein
MEDTKEFTKEKLKAVTSDIKASRQTSPASVNMNAGQTSVTSDAKFQAEAEKLRDALAIAKDLLNQWACRLPNGAMPKPYISTKFGMLVIALPLGGHVIDNIVTSDGKHDFAVDGISVIPDVTVTSNEKSAQGKL